MEPTLYLLMRKDIQDMNPGKAVAQGAHAAQMFTARMEQLIASDSDESSVQRVFDSIDAYNDWKGDRAFGRTLTVMALHEEIESIVNLARIYMPERAGICLDETYPWRNWYGEVFLSEEETCGYVFTWDHPDFETLNSQLMALKLMP